MVPQSVIQKNASRQLALVLCMICIIGFCGPGWGPEYGFAAPATLPKASSQLSLIEELVRERKNEQLIPEARSALQRTLQSLDLQTQAPAEVTEMRSSGRLNPDWHPSENLAKVLLWAGILVMLAVVLFNFKGNLWSFSRSRRLEQEKAEAAPVAVAARMDKARVSADALAQQGGYAEAMHMLLLQSVSELRRRLDTPIASSLTSREILRRLALAPLPRKSFADIIIRVEISYFGAHQPGRDDYLACRQSFESLTAALGQDFGPETDQNEEPKQGEQRTPGRPRQEGAS